MLFGTQCICMHTKLVKQKDIICSHIFTVAYLAIIFVLKHFSLQRGVDWSNPKPL